MNSSLMTTVVIACLGLLALYFLFRAIRQFRRRRYGGGVFGILSALVLVLIALCTGLIGFGLQGYQRLTYERTAAEVHFRKTGERAYSAIVHYPSGGVGEYRLQGDDWQIDARMLSFKPLMNILGFDAAYRLERLSGRYRSIEDEQKQPRTVHALQPESALDLWEIARRYREWSPWVDAYYGSATYVPMEDGAVYAVAVTQSGLQARPMNESAKKAVGNWQ